METDRPLWKAPVIFSMAVLFLCLQCLHPARAKFAEGSFYMDSASQCHYSGYLLIRTEGIINIFSRKPGNSGSDELGCTMSFKPEDDRDIIDVAFTHLTISDDDVTLRVDLTGDVIPAGSGSYTLSAGSRKPDKMQSKNGIATISLSRLNLDDRDYSFGIIIRVYKEDDSLMGDDEKPMAVGLVVGIVAGIIIFLVFIAVLVVCCYRKKREEYRARGDNDYKVDLAASSNSPPRKFGLDNAARNGNYLPREEEVSPPLKKKPLSSQPRPPQYQESSVSSESDSREDSVRKFNGSPSRPGAMKYENERNSAYNEHQGLRRKPEIAANGRQKESNHNQRQGGPPKSPILSALQSNPRFRASFHAAEQEAEERARRISGEINDAANDSDVSYTETWNTTFDTNFDDDPRPPAGSFIKPPTLPPVPMSPRTPERREHTASIHRAPRPSSSSSEIENLQAGGGVEGGVSMNPEGEGPPSPSEIVPIRVHDPHSPSIKRKADVQHTLRPDRNKKLASAREPQKDPADAQPAELPRPKSRSHKSTANKSKPKPEKADADRKPKTKKPAEPVTPQPKETGDHPHREAKNKPKEAGPEYEGRFKKSDSVRKSKSKSPRIGRSRSTGTGLEDTDSIGQPSTPRGYRAVPRVTADDYEDSDVESNYNPLRRTGSKNSLYASRSSLYSRRRRKNSAGESVYSFAHDDLDQPDRDSFREHRLSRRDRPFRSLGDLEMELRDQKTRSTQTLRECATQTGKGFANVTPGNKRVAKKSRPSSVSSSHTQTTKSNTRNLDSSSSSSGVTRPRERKNSASSATGRSKSRDRANSASSASGKVKQRKNDVDTRNRQSGDEEGSRQEKPKPKVKPRKVAPTSAGQRSDDDDLESVRTGMTGPLDHSSSVGGMQPQAARMPGQPGAYAPQGYPVYPAGYPAHMAYMQATGQPPMMPYPQVGAVPHHSGAVVANPAPNVPTPSVAVTGGAAAKPSKWDMLCRLTDADGSKEGDWNDSASIAGSVFSNPYAGHQVHPGYSSAVSDYAASEQSGPSRSRAGRSHASRTGSKSAWEALREMTDQESQYAPSESNV